MITKQIDRDANPPTVVGPHGAAWLLDMAKIRAAVGVRKKRTIGEDEDGTVATWIVFAPWAHMAWAYYSIGCVHLRPLPKLGPARILLPGATHEVMVYAMDPGKVPDVTDPGHCWLSPANFHGQWIVPERPNPFDLDRAAAEKIRGCVEEILAGVLSPDEDFRHQWIARFTDSNIKK